MALRTAKSADYLGNAGKHIMNMFNDELNRDGIVALAKKQNAKYGKTVICSIDEIESRDFNTAKLTGKYDLETGQWEDMSLAENITAGEFYSNCGYHVQGIERPVPEVDATSKVTGVPETELDI